MKTTSILFASMFVSATFLASPLLAQTPASAVAADVKVLFDFEDGKPGPFSAGVTTENVPQGKYAIVAKDEAAITEKVMDWSGYDLLKVDVFNPQDEPVMLLVEIRDAQTKDYWTRVNYWTVMPPGKSTVTVPTDIYVGEKSRPGRPLFKSKITRFILAPEKRPIVFDNIRLQKLDVAGVQFDGLKAFDFGLPQSPKMPGYQIVTDKTMYDAAGGIGWLPKASVIRGFDGMQPDALYQDFIVAMDATFRVDLPNGKYHVIMNIDCPGGYWGEVQVYTQRQVLCNDKPVVDEKMTMEQFEKSYFRNAHQEDLPGLDVFSQYVEPMFHVKQFDIEVSDGKALFTFKGDGRWANALSAMVIYPAAKAEAGKKFWDWTTQQRKEQFNDYFKQVLPKASGAKAPADGYVLFTRRSGELAGALDGPQPDDILHSSPPKAGLSCTLAGDEEQAIRFALQPGEDLGQIEVTVSPPGTKFGSILPAGTLQPGWIDYRITRVNMEGSVYTVSPRYWHPSPAPGAKVTRNFWIRAKVPKGTPAGTYVSSINVKPARGQSQSIFLTITVLPFSLDPVTDVAAGPWGCGITLPWDVGDQKTDQWNWEMFEKVLAALHANGFTTVTGLPHIGVKAAKGKMELDFAVADKQMKALRDHGFDQMVSSYGDGLGYEMYGTAKGPDDQTAKRAGYADAEAYLKDLYGQIEKHSEQANWLPIAWNLCDEPLKDAAKASAINAALHDKVYRDLKLKRQTFMGATSMTGNDPKDDHYALVNSLTMPSLNLHDDATIKLIQSKGHKFSFYNGGNRWTYGRYMKALVVKYDLAYRPTWHLNACAGNPYYALDCREDDYCFYNTDEKQTLVPSLLLLNNNLPGLNDYRYLSTLQRLIKEKAGPAAAEAQKVFDQQVNLVAGKDRDGHNKPEQFDADRQAVTKAILSLVEGKK